MKAELKAKWVAALRGGRYQQAFGRLQCSDGSVCAMGVLCRVARQLGPSEADADDRAYRWLRRIGVEVNDFMDLNDAMGLSFEAIADWVEKNIKAEA